MDGMGYEFLGNWWPQVFTHGDPEILTRLLTGDWGSRSFRVGISKLPEGPYRVSERIQGNFSNANVYIHLGPLSGTYIAVVVVVTFWKKHDPYGKAKGGKRFGNSWELWFSPTLICLYNVPYFVVDSKTSACQSFWSPAAPGLHHAARTVTCPERLAARRIWNCKANLVFWYLVAPQQSMYIHTKIHWTCWISPKSLCHLRLVSFLKMLKVETALKLRDNNYLETSSYSHQ